MNQNQNKKQCIRGHLFTPENTKVYVNQDTGREFRTCLTCHKLRTEKDRNKLNLGVKYPPKNKGIDWLEELVENNYISRLGYEYDRDKVDELLLYKKNKLKFEQWEKEQREWEEKEQRERDLANAIKENPTKILSGSIVLK